MYASAPYKKKTCASDEAGLLQGLVDPILILLGLAALAMSGLACVDVVLPELEALDALLAAEHAALLGHGELLLGDANAPAEAPGHVVGHDAAAELLPVPGDVALGRVVVAVAQPGEQRLYRGLIGAVAGLDDEDARPERAQPHRQPQLLPQARRLLEVVRRHQLDAAARAVEHGPEVHQRDDAARAPEDAAGVVRQELGQVARQLREVQRLAAAARDVLGGHEAQLAGRLGRERARLGAAAAVGPPCEALG